MGPESVQAVGASRRASIRSETEMVHRDAAYDLRCIGALFDEGGADAGRIVGYSCELDILG